MKNPFRKVIGLFRPAATAAGQSAENKSRPATTSGHCCCQHSDTVKLPAIWPATPPPPPRHGQSGRG